MSKIIEARAAVADAEHKVRGLIQIAAREGSYAEVEDLVLLAQRLRDLGPEQPRIAPSLIDEPRAAPARTSTKGRGKSPAYPRFERDEDRLIKVGWSKREKREYEHKAPRAAALAVYLRLGQVKARKAFRMDEILPVDTPATLPDGTEVPAYQAYVVLAWLRSVGQIEKSGNDSYQWALAQVTEDTFDDAWESLPMQGRK